MQESLNDKAISTLTMAKRVYQIMEGVNDYTKGTGFCDEHEQIINDFHSHLGSIRARLSRLERRLEKHNESNK